MPGYVAKALQRFQHDTLTKTQHQTHSHVPQNYGAKTKYITPLDDAQSLEKEGNKFSIQVTGTFYYYSRSVGGTMLTVPSDISSKQSSPTEHIIKKCKQFLNCTETESDVILVYQANYMILAIHSVAYYLQKPKAQSIVGSHHLFQSILISHPTMVWSGISP